MVAHRVVQLRCSRSPYEVVLDNGNALAARAIVISTRAQYNRPTLAPLKKFEGQGIYYGATYIESQLCEDQDVVVVGGGNSAGQAAVFLSQTARKVHMRVRSQALSDKMSRYLIQRIADNSAINLHYQREIVGLEGGTQLEKVTWLDRATGETSSHNIRHVFIMAGASPRTEWLKGCVLLDDKGFILTGRNLDSVRRPGATFRLAPYASSTVARNQSSRGFCGRRRPLRQRQAGGSGGGRRGDFHPLGPPSVSRVLIVIAPGFDLT